MLGFKSSFAYLRLRKKEIFENMSDAANYYKGRYIFYKEKYQQMVNLLKRFQELLDDPGIPLPSCDSPSPPKTGSAQLHPKDRTPSPILGFGRRGPTIIKKRLDLSSRQELTDSNDFVENGGQRPNECKLDDRSDTQQEPSDKECNEESDDWFTDFEPGSNKWECMSAENLDSNMYSEDSVNQPKPERKPTSGLSLSPLDRLKTFKKYSGLELRNETVSTKIRGVARRMLPGQTCEKCSDYMECAGLGQDTLNRSSRHRGHHKRLNTPTDFWSLDISQQVENIKKRDQKKNKRPKLGL